VDVIFDPIEAKEVAVQIFVDAPKIFENLLSLVGLKGGRAVFGGEGDVVEKLGVGVGHDGVGGENADLRNCRLFLAICPAANAAE
jgi:hypothetical protein